MKPDLPLERNLGPQPLAEVLQKHGLKAQDLVSTSTEQITHKMVARACKGRRLTSKVQAKIRNAVNAATAKSYSTTELFTY
jgi:hypothetical protein